MAEKRQVVIVSAARTAIGRFQGALGSVPASTLGSVVIREAVKRAGIDPAQIDEVLMGNVVQAGQGQAPARQASIQAGPSRRAFPPPSVRQPSTRYAAPDSRQ